MLRQFIRAVLTEGKRNWDWRTLNMLLKPHGWSIVTDPQKWPEGHYEELAVFADAVEETMVTGRMGKKSMGQERSFDMQVPDILRAEKLFAEALKKGADRSAIRLAQEAYAIVPVPAYMTFLRKGLPGALAVVFRFPKKYAHLRDKIEKNGYRIVSSSSGDVVYHPKHWVLIKHWALTSISNVYDTCGVVIDVSGHDSGSSLEVRVDDVPYGYPMLLPRTEHAYSIVSNAFSNLANYRYPESIDVDDAMGAYERSTEANALSPSSNSEQEYSGIHVGHSWTLENAIEVVIS